MCAKNNQSLQQFSDTYFVFSFYYKEWDEEKEKQHNLVSNQIYKFSAILFNEALLAFSLIHFTPIYF